MSKTQLTWLSGWDADRDFVRAKMPEDFVVTDVQRVHNPGWLTRYRRGRAALATENESGLASERMAFLVHPRASEVLTMDFQDYSGELHASFRDGIRFSEHVIEEEEEEEDDDSSPAPCERHALFCRVALTHESQLASSEFRVHRADQVYPAYLITYQVKEKVAS